ncbi:MAG: 50S ribosomal protein L13 [Terriglobia bacterium]
MGTYFQRRKRGKVRWRVLNAEGFAVGRLAARAAKMLMGKDCPDYTPHEDHREGVIIVNSDKVVLTGRKLDSKMYRRHTGYPGGLKEVTARRTMETKPQDVVRMAIEGMLPKTRLGDQVGHRLRVYAGPVHPHSVQKPEEVHLHR